MIVVIVLDSERSTDTVVVAIIAIVASPIIIGITGFLSDKTENPQVNVPVYADIPPTAAPSVVDTPDATMELLPQWNYCRVVVMRISLLKSMEIRSVLNIGGGMMYQLRESMNKKLEQFAREELKKDLARPGYHCGGKKSFVYGDRNVPINDIVDSMPAEKLDWALTQVENSLKKIKSNE